MTDTAEQIKRSVTAGDYADNPYSGPGVYYITAPSVYARPIADLQPYWTVSRDFQLRATVMMESMWAAAVFKAITKRAARGFEVSDPADQQVGPDGKPKISRRTKQAQELLLSAQPGHGTPGWVPFLSKQLRDFLTTDNGSFIEIIRASSAAGSKIIGLAHLDGVRCRRTGDPDIPVLYRDRKGYEHELKDHQVLTFSDMPDPGDTYYGVGLCAAARSYGTIAKLAAIERYVYEKVSGTRALAIHFVSGVNDKQLQAALRTAEETQLQRGIYSYMGALIVSMMGDVVPQVATVPLSDLPDGFDAEKERDNAYLVFANNIGVAVQDVKPLSGQGLGTGTQTQVLDDAQEAMGLAAYDKQLEHAMNTFVLPATTTVHFLNMHDMRDQKQKADVQLVRAQARAARIQSGEIDPPIARQLAADDGDLKPEFLPRDETAQGDLSDDEKPFDGPVIISPLAQSAPTSMPAKGGDMGAAPAPAMKARGPITRRLRDRATIARAKRLYEEALAGA